MSNAPHPRQAHRPVQALAPGLYIVATPIGNLRDITLRALDVLAAANAVFAEDTRIARRLLDAHGISRSVETYHDHNGEAVRPRILARLAAGEAVALISDAGTPLISDPGFKLARAVIEAGADIFPVPGASAALAALCGAGLASDRFLFAGFPPAKSAPRKAWLAELSAVKATLIFYESGARLAASLADMAQAFPGRGGVVARELTKIYEEFQRDTLDALARRYAETGPPKGEIVVLIAPPEADARWSEAEVDAALRVERGDRPLKAVSAEIAARAGWPKRDVYARGLAIQNADAPPD